MSGAKWSEKRESEIVLCRCDMKWEGGRSSGRGGHLPQFISARTAEWWESLVGMGVSQGELDQCCDLGARSVSEGALSPLHALMSPASDNIIKQ